MRMSNPKPHMSFAGVPLVLTFANERARENNTNVRTRTLGRDMEQYHFLKPVTTLREPCGNWPRAVLCRFCGYSRPGKKSQRAMRLP